MLESYLLSNLKVNGVLSLKLYTFVIGNMVNIKIFKNMTGEYI